MRFWWPAAFSQGSLDLALTPGLLLLNDDTAADETILHEQWRRWLALFNTLQVLPGFVMATERGVRDGDYAAVAPAGLTAPVEGPATALGAAWGSVIESAVADVRTGLHHLAAAGVDIPEVGYEYAEAGVVVAEAELAWPRAKVCVLLDNQSEFGETWANAGWHALPLSTDWTERALTSLKTEHRERT